MRDKVRELALWAVGQEQEVLSTPGQGPPAAPGGAHAGAGLHTVAHGGHHTGAGGYAWKELQPLETPCWSRFILKELQPVGRSREEECEEEGTAESDLRDDHNSSFPVPFHQ